MSLHDAALAYWERGWSVIPLEGKKPKIEWRTFQTERAKKGQINQWWEKWPTANIGIVTGKISDIVVVDVDLGSDLDINNLPDYLETGMKSKTGSGGFHLIYEYPEGVESVPNKVGMREGIDLRGDGGYIVAPPSDHDSGNFYEWIEMSEPTPLPNRLREEIYADKSSESGRSEWITTAMLGVQHGGRNQAAARLVGYFAGKGHPIDIIHTVMDSWNQKNSPPLKKGELVRTIESVYRIEHKKRTNDIIENKKEFEVVGMQDYMARHGGSMAKWLIEDWLPDSSILFMVSPPGTFKTWLLCDLAVSVAGGFPFLGQYPVKNPGPVVVVQQEDFHGDLCGRLATIIQSRQPYGVDINEETFKVALPPELPIYFHPDRLLRFDDPSIMDSFEKRMHEIKPRLVLIDPLYAAADTEGYMMKAAGQMLQFKQIRDELGTAFAFLHHTKKSESDGRQGAWGSQFLNAFLESGWQIRASDVEATINVDRHFKVSSNPEPISLQFGINTETIPSIYKVETSEKEIESMLDLIKSAASWTIEELSEKMGIPLTHVWTRVKSMQNENIVTLDEWTGSVAAHGE